MKKHFKSLSIALAAVIIFSSCFKIEQVIRFKGLDSGSVEYVVDLSSMMSMIKSLEGMGGEVNTEEAEEAKTPDSEELIKSSFGEIKIILEAIEGVSGVALIDEEEKARFGIRADFASMKALNTLLSVLNDEAEEKKDFTYREFVSRKKNNYEYLEPIDLKANLAKSLNMEGDSKEEASPLGGVDPMMFFNELSVSNKMVFENKKVKKTTNPASVISEDKHAVQIISYPFKKENTVILKNKVTVQ